jgi:hypothetical protein
MSSSSSTIVGDAATVLIDAFSTAPAKVLAGGFAVSESAPCCLWIQQPSLHVSGDARSILRTDREGEFSEHEHSRAMAGALACLVHEAMDVGKEKPARTRAACDGFRSSGYARLRLPAACAMQFTTFQ